VSLVGDRAWQGKLLAELCALITSGTRQAPRLRQHRHPCHICPLTAGQCQSPGHQARARILRSVPRQPSAYRRVLNVHNGGYLRQHMKSQVTLRDRLPVNLGCRPRLAEFVVADGPSGHDQVSRHALAARRVGCGPAAR